MSRPGVKNTFLHFDLMARNRDASHRAHTAPAMLRYREFARSPRPSISLVGMLAAAPPVQCFTLRIADGVSLGLDIFEPVSSSVDQSLLVLEVASGGAVNAWNRLCNDDARRVMPGDRIVEINGARTAAAMRVQYQDKSLLKMKVLLGPRHREAKKLCLSDVLEPHLPQCCPVFTPRTNDAQCNFEALSFTSPPRMHNESSSDQDHLEDLLPTEYVANSLPESRTAVWSCCADTIPLPTDVSEFGLLVDKSEDDNSTLDASSPRSPSEETGSNGELEQQEQLVLRSRASVEWCEDSQRLQSKKTRLTKSHFCDFG